MSLEKDELRRKLREEDAKARSVYLPVGIQTENAPDTPVPTIHPEILADISRAATVFGYLAIPPEPEVSPLLDIGITGGARVLVPRIVGRDMVFAPIASTAGPFDIGPYGIREPLSDIAPVWPGEIPEGPILILVPGLAFSRDGARLGRGKGYYDRFLSAFVSEADARDAEVRIVGVCRPDRVLEGIPTESHDMAVDCLWTEKNGIFTLY